MCPIRADHTQSESSVAESPPRAARTSSSTPTVKLQLEAFNRALEPKRLVLLNGGHFCCHDDEFEPAVAASIDWFVAHLA